jgi:hypothetical protein
MELRLCRIVRVSPWRMTVSRRFPSLAHFCARILSLSTDKPAVVNSNARIGRQTGRFSNFLRIFH